MIFLLTTAAPTIAHVYVIFGLDLKTRVIKTRAFSVSGSVARPIFNILESVEINTLDTFKTHKIIAATE